MIILALGFGLGVLATVIAGERDRRRRSPLQDHLDYLERIQAQGFGHLSISEIEDQGIRIK